LTRDPVYYAAVARQMTDTGEWVVPKFGDEIYLKKPPLVIWMAAGMMEAFGPTGFAARFPSAVLGVVAVLLTYLLALRLADRQTAFLAVVILATSYTWLRAGRTLRLETVVATTTLAALLLYLWAADRPRFPRWAGLAFFTLVGLGTLGKGYAGLLPLGLVVVGAPRAKVLRSPWFWGGSIAFLLLVGGWLLLVRRELGPDWTLAFSADVSEYGGSEGRLAMFIRKIPVGFVRKNIPWAPLYVLGLVVGAVALFRGAPSERRRSWLLLSWLLIVVVAVFAKEYQYTRYLASVCPALAILAAIPLRFVFRRKSFAPLVCAVALLVLGGAFVLAVFPIKTSGRPHRLAAVGPVVEAIVPKGESIPFVGGMGDGRRANIYWYCGRKVETVPPAYAGALKGTGRLALIDDEARPLLPDDLVLEVAFIGDRYVLARIE
jgi:4-amino-4-deoxy-L-arabinose transferase-like glycosyltransferase